MFIKHSPLVQDSVVDGYCFINKEMYVYLPRERERCRSRAGCERRISRGAVGGGRREGWDGVGSSKATAVKCSGLTN